MTEETVIEKIRKLLALAERAGTPAEAEAAFGRAQALMAKHAIDEARVAERTGRGEEIGPRHIVVKIRDEIRRAKGMLLHRLAMANNCQAVDVGEPGFLVVGHESDAEFVELLFHSVLIQYAGERTRAWKAYQAQPGYKQSRHIWVNAFAFSYAQRIGERLQDATAEEARATGAELVLLTRGQQVETWMDTNMRTKEKRVRVRGDSHAERAGRDAADRANLSGGRGSRLELE